jgi:hypothetical protein
LRALLLAAFCCNAAFAEDGGAPLGPDPDAPTVGASLDKIEVLVGDRVNLTLSAVARAGIAVTLPAKLGLGKLELLERAPSDKLGRDLGDGRSSHKFVLGVAAYETGELEVPSIALEYLNPRGEVRTVATAPITLRVKALVAGEANPEIQPPRPPRAALVEDKRVMKLVRYAAVGVGGVVLFGLVALLLRRAFRRPHSLADVALIPRRPPEEVAMEKLRALRAAGKFSVDGYRPFYFAVAEIVRAYLGGRYNFDSLELTSTELLAELASRAPHLASESGEVARFLADSDLVKFARTGSSDEAAFKSLDAAQAIILSTAAPLEETVAAISGPVRLPKPDDRQGGGVG